MIALADVKTWLGIDATDTTWDSLLADLEGRAVAFVERLTGRYFRQNGATSEILPGTGMPRLYLKEPTTNTSTQAITVTYVQYPGDTATTITATAADGYTSRSEGNEGWLVRYGANVWERGYEFTVGYRRGYTLVATATTGDDISAPGEIRQLVLDLIALKYRLRNQEGIVSETIDNYSYRLGDFSQTDLDAIPWAKATVEKWRRPNI